MASSFFARLGSRRLLGGGAAAIAAGVAGTQLSSGGDKNVGTTEAEIQFHTSYGYLQKGKQLIKPPEGWTGRVFEIRNDYPTLAEVKNRGVKVAGAKNLPLLPDPGAPIHLNPIDDAPWLNIDFKTNPEDYCKVIKEYCWEGNVNNEFVLQKNKLRQWYHAPWMHWSQNGREPLNGLTFERPTPVGELAETQTRPLQTWACGYYNEAGAATFGDVWKDPNIPRWENVKFQLGTCVFKILMSDATAKEVSTMKDAPTLQGVIAPPGAKNGSVRQDKPSPLGLLQVDFAVRDDRADIGWVFGTFMYNGNMSNPDPWDRLLPVGIMWGNDPELTPDKVAAGGKPKESWINPVADDIRESLAGSRPSWGWLGRMNGPADNFKSACASCHSVSERDHIKYIKMVPADGDSTEEKMRWFRNIPAGKPFTEGNVSGDYSLQLMMGYSNYKAWLNTQKNIFRRTMIAVPFTQANKEAAVNESLREPLRSTPEDRGDDGKN